LDKIAPPLPGSISLSVSEFPKSVSVNERIRIRAQVKNNSGFTLDSLPPHSVSCSYRWFNFETDAILADEPERASFAEPFENSSELVVEITALTPALPGKYIFVVTMVQETVAWWFDPPSFIYTSAAVIVNQS
jgi:hypothetical protein